VEEEEEEEEESGNSRFPVNFGTLIYQAHGTTFNSASEC
jgi:hypothetical protein